MMHLVRVSVCLSEYLYGAFRVKCYSSWRELLRLLSGGQVDQNYVGKILPKEVTLTNLNNNINVSFLQDMCKAFGDIRKSIIFYHPKTKKHLGIAQVSHLTSSPPLS